MQLIIDATALRLYPVAKGGFSGGTELYVRKLAEGLSQRGHVVHVVAPDLDAMEMRGATEFWWPPSYHPTSADAIVMVHNLEGIAPYSADLLVLASNGLGAFLGPDDEWATGVDAVACFSQCHIDLLCKAHPKVPREKCHVTGLGVELDEYGDPCHVTPGQCLNCNSVPADLCTNIRVKGRLLYANDPQRGLWHLLDIFEHVKREVDYASLHVAYDFERQFESVKWQSSAMAELLWGCKRRIKTTPGVVSLGALDREQVIREQLECQVHAMPSDPPNVGSQIHGITQMECAAAGCALVLSDTEAFPEVFGEAAEILPVPGWFDPRAERRWDAQDWADVIVELIKDEAKWAGASRKARALAEKHTWGAVVEKWDAMLAKLAGVAV